jgi:hypothetical protein
MNNTIPRAGTRVRFTIDKLGASRRDELRWVTGESYGVGDEGHVAFPHPNRKRCPEWFYVEVESKNTPGEKRYVGVTARMVITSPPCDYVARKGLLDSRRRLRLASPRTRCPRACTLTAALTSLSSMSPQCGQEWTRTCSPLGTRS